MNFVNYDTKMIDIEMIQTYAQFYVENHQLRTGRYKIVAVISMENFCVNE